MKSPLIRVPTKGVTATNPLVKYSLLGSAAELAVAFECWQAFGDTDQRLLQDIIHRVTRTVGTDVAVKLRRDMPHQIIGGFES